MSSPNDAYRTRRSEAMVMEFQNITYRTVFASRFYRVLIGGSLEPLWTALSTSEHRRMLADIADAVGDGLDPTRFKIVVREALHAVFIEPTWEVDGRRWATPAVCVRRAPWGDGFETFPCRDYDTEYVGEPFLHRYATLSDTAARARIMAEALLDQPEHHDSAYLIVKDHEDQIELSESALDFLASLGIDLTEEANHRNGLGNGMRIMGRGLGEFGER